MIRIKVSIPGFKSDVDISQYIGADDKVLDGCRFYVNDVSAKEVDYWFVIDDLFQSTEDAIVSPDHIYFLTAEVLYPLGFYDLPDKVRFLEQFSNLITCYDVFADNAVNEPPFLGWMANSNHGQSIFSPSSRDLNWFERQNNIEKTKLMSVICSNKEMTPEHRVRLKFVRKLKEYFGAELDWFGNGVNPIDEKWSGIAPYKYHIVLENQSRSNVITEKLYDSYLAHSYPIYWGAPNVHEYFLPGALTEIDILDPRKAIQKIEAVVRSGTWEQSYALLIESKGRVLWKYNPFMRMAQIARNRASKGSSELIRLYSIASAGSIGGGCLVVDRTRFAVSRALEKLGRRITCWAYLKAL